MTHLHDPLLTLDEAGDALGSGPGLPRRLVAEGRLPCVDDGDGPRIPQSALIAYVTTLDAGPRPELHAVHPEPNDHPAAAAPAA